MKYLLDTQVLFWVFGEPDKLTARVAQVIKDQGNDLYVSKASFWEAAIKMNIGKLSLPFDLEKLLQETLANNMRIIEIEMEHILKYVDMPLHHRDPFDRLIISQATVENLTIISSDEKFSFYDIKQLW